MTNNDPAAILIVTRRGGMILGKGSAGALGNPAADVCLAFNAITERWLIVQQGDAPLAVGSSFNVLIFKV